MNDITVQVRDIRTGDVFADEKGVIRWTARADAEVTEDGAVIVKVQHADGGRGARQWSARDADWLLTVRRP